MENISTKQMVAGLIRILETPLQPHPTPDEIAAFAEESLTPAEMARLETHFSVCPECLEELEWHGAFTTTINEIPLEPSALDRLQASLKVWLKGMTQALAGHLIPALGGDTGDTEFLARDGQGWKLRGHLEQRIPVLYIFFTDPRRVDELAGKFVTVKLSSLTDSAWNQEVTLHVVEDYFEGQWIASARHILPEGQIVPHDLNLELVGVQETA